MRQRILPVLVFLLAALLLPPLALGKFPALSLPSFAPQSADEEDLGWIGESAPSSQASQAEEVMLPADSPLDITEFKILNSATGQVETVSVRDYVRGAVAAELPATFHAEAMKAQAVAAHTWALHCALTRRNPDPALKGADFSADPDHLKGYARAEDIKATYGNMADEYWDKITTAADSVMDYVLLYDGEPIQAVYHSCRHRGHRVSGECLAGLGSLPGAGGVGGGPGGSRRRSRGDLYLRRDACPAHRCL